MSERFLTKLVDRSANIEIQTNPNLGGFNYLNNQTAIVPRPLSFARPTNAGNTFRWSVPKYSINVLQFDI
jgi:hypothetical protein